MRLAPLLLLCLAGCTCGPQPQPDAGAGGITGDVIDHYLQMAGVQPFPVKLANRTITAWVEQEDGTFTAYPGTGFDDGNFVVPGVPEGPYIVKSGTTIIATSARTLHLGSNRLGRPDTFIAVRGEGVELTLTNLAPWTEDDELQLVSWNAAQGYFSTEQRSPPFAANGPDAGDTALTAAFIDFEDQSVVQAERGDDFTILQLSTTKDAGVTWHVATRAIQPALSLAIGVPTPVSGAMTTLTPLDGDFQVRAGEFTRCAPEVGPGAKAFTARLLVDVHPGPFGTTTHTGGTPDLAVVELPPDAGDTHLVFQYGNPFPPAWRPFVSAGALFDVQYRLPLPDGGVTSPRSELGYVTTAVVLADAVAAPLAPRVTPLRSITIDGRDATLALTDVPLNPVVAWQPPAVGTVSRVEIEVIELAAAASGATRRFQRDLLRVVDGRTSIRFPPGFLNPRASYLLRLTALSLPPAYDPASPLVDVGPPAGAASVLTAVFTTR